MQATYQHQTSYGLNLLANYTLSHCMTDQTFYANNNGSGGVNGNYRALWLPGFGAKGDYALCDTDSTHVVHVSGEYQLPVGRGKMFVKNVNRGVDEVIGGWAANFHLHLPERQSILRRLPCRNNGGFRLLCRCRVPGADIYAGGKRQQEWLNPAAFVNPPDGDDYRPDELRPFGRQSVSRRAVLTSTTWTSRCSSSFRSRRSAILSSARKHSICSNTAEFGQPGNTSGFTSTDAAKSAMGSARSPHCATRRG